MINVKLLLIIGIYAIDLVYFQPTSGRLPVTWNNMVIYTGQNELWVRKNVRQSAFGENKR